MTRSRNFGTDELWQGITRVTKTIRKTGHLREQMRKGASVTLARSQVRLRG